MCAARSEAAIERVAQSNRSYWTSWLMGEVAMWAILVAAVENSDVKGHTLAHAWVRSQLDEHIAALTNTRSEEIALGSGRAEEELIASYATPSVISSKTCRQRYKKWTDLLIREKQQYPFRSLSTSSRRSAGLSEGRLYPSPFRTTGCAKPGATGGSLRRRDAELSRA